MWDGDRFSILIVLFLTTVTSSTPTVWDGDLSFSVAITKLTFCSKPTVWDGDVASALEGAKTIPCSEPTAWDGDRTISRSAYMLAGGVLFFEPTVWDGDTSSRLTMYAYFSNQGSKPTAWDGDS